MMKKCSAKEQKNCRGIVDAPIRTGISMSMTEQEISTVAALDAGNTHIRVVLRKKETPDSVHVFATDRSLTSVQIEELLLTVPGMTDARGSVFTSVVRELDGPLCTALERITEAVPVIAGPSIKTGFCIRYEPPSSLGPDRIANAAGAFSAYPEKDILLVDAGTAVTFCVLLAEKIFDGGLIVPGTGLAAEALSLRTSRLPYVDAAADAPLVGRSTRDGIAGGLLHGWASMIDGIHARVEASYGRGFLLLLTGGGAAILEPHVQREHILDPGLTVKGLFALYDLNR
jgi:type III pantothenate kinase